MNPKAALFESRHLKIAENDGSWYSEAFQAEVFEALASRVAVVAKPPGRLIEFGCGTGENVRNFALAGWEATGVDVSATAIAAAIRRSNGGSHYVCANLSETLKDEIPAADVLLDGHCYHFQLGEERPIYLENVKRSLKPGGWFIVNSLIGEPKGSEVDFNPLTRISRMGGVETNYYATMDEIEAELSTAGFQVAQRDIASGEAEIGILWARKGI